jgi:hypothetical protein
MAVNPLQDFEISIHPLGNELRGWWKLPSTLPDVWKVYIFKREGEDVTQDEIDDYFDTETIADGLIIFEMLSDLPPKLYDLEVENGTTYYYKSVIQDTDSEEYSTTLSDNGTPAYDSTLNVIDCKELVIEAVKRLMQNYDVDVDKDIDIRKTLSLMNFTPPGFSVTRQPANVIQNYLGDLISLDDAVIKTGQVEMEFILVTWSDVVLDRRDRLTKLFRASRFVLKRYLLEQGLMDVKFAIGGDDIDPRWQDGTLHVGSMVVQCMVETSLEHEDQDYRGTSVDFQHQVWT